MDSSEYFRLQNIALAEVETLTKKMESGELPQADAEQRIIAVMQTLEQQTSGYLPALRASLTHQRRILRIIPWALVAAILAVAVYRVFA